MAEIENDLFSTVTMLDAIDEMQNFIPKQFLTTTFFKPALNIESEILQIDVLKGARRVAPFVHPLKEGKLVEKMGRETTNIRPPYIKILGETNAADILKRRAGEPVYRSGMSGIQIAAEKVGQQLQEAIMMIQRRIEVMAADALRSGKITVVGEGLSGEIDFKRDPNHIVQLVGTDVWDNIDSDPTEHILDWKRKIAQKTGLNADILVLGHLALKAFLKNKKVRELLDNRRFELGGITSEDVPAGSTFYGEIHGVNLYSYNDWYLDEAGVEQPMVFDKEVLFGATSAQNMLHYAAIRDVEAGVVAVPYWPKSWTIPNPSARMLLVQSAPLIALHQPDSTLRVNVLT